MCYIPYFSTCCCCLSLYAGVALIAMFQMWYGLILFWGPADFSYKWLNNDFPSKMNDPNYKFKTDMKKVMPQFMAFFYRFYLFCLGVKLILALCYDVYPYFTCWKNATKVLIVILLLHLILRFFSLWFDRDQPIFYYEGVILLILHLYFLTIVDSYDY